MDAKTRANFINAVAGGQSIPCPNCNTLNDSDSLFCISCGTKLIRPKQEAAEAEKPAAPKAPAFAPVSDAAAPAGQAAAAAPKASAFAPVSDAAAPAGQAAAAAPKASAFAPIARPAAKAPAPAVRQAPAPEKRAAFNFAAAEPEPDDEPVSVFAEGLPAWDLVPPQIMVRRKPKR